MGSTAPDTFGSQQEQQAYPVKAEYSVYEDQHQLQSSEEEYSSQAPDGEQISASDTHLSFGDGFGQSIAPATASSSTMPTKDPIPISKRTLQNRKAQREFRQRRATYLKDLEAKVRRFEAGEPAGVHPEVHHRINHLVQEIQYLRTIIDRLQQENAELRRADSGYSGHQPLPGASQAAYTLHPPYPPSTSIERSPDSYSSNSHALAEMFQPGYQASSFASRPHLDVEPAHAAHSLPTSAVGSHGHHNFPSDNPRAPTMYQSGQHMDWSAMRQSSGPDRPRTAPLDASRPGAHPPSDHDGSDPSPAYLYHNSNQSSYYHPSNHPPSVQRDASAHNTISQEPHSMSTSSTEPRAAGSIGNPYAQYGHNVSHHQHTSQGLGVSSNTPPWQPHNANSANLGFHTSGAVQNESIEYSYHPPPHHGQASLQEPSRSGTHSPAGGPRTHTGAVPT